MGKMCYLIKNAVMKVHPHGLLLPQVDLQDVQLPSVEAIGALLQSFPVHLSLHSFLSLPPTDQLTGISQGLARQKCGQNKEKPLTLCPDQADTGSQHICASAQVGPGMIQPRDTDRHWQH